MHPRHHHRPRRPKHATIGGLALALAVALLGAGEPTAPRPVQLNLAPIPPDAP